MTELARGVERGLFSADMVHVFGESRRSPDATIRTRERTARLRRRCRRGERSETHAELAPQEQQLQRDLQ